MVMDNGHDFNVQLRYSPVLRSERLVQVKNQQSML